jgi:translation initiation factor IF-2
MAKTRVHDLAKEYGMTSKEMLGHLQEMKIPAKSPSSALEDAYVAMVRKQLAPVLEARAAEIAAAKQAEAEAEAKAKAEEKAKAEAERIEAEKRRDEERAEEARERAAAAEAKAKADAERAAAEEARRAEEERNRVRDTAPKATPSFSSLLDQIAQQEKILEEKKAEAPAKQAVSRGKDAASRKSARGTQSGKASEEASPNPDKAAAQRHPKGHHAHREGEGGEDRYSRMAHAAEEYNRERVLEDARAAVDEATRESTGRRKKRKERRQQQAEEAAHEQAVEEAIANDQDVSQLDIVKVPQGSTVAELADLLDVPANDIVKRLFLLGTPLTMTQSMSDDLIELVANDIGREVKVMSKEEENSFTFFDDPKDLLPRPPVVTVMGHVDHGKTSLLDAIRHTGVAEGEAGGITQHIGASQVKIKGRTITFVDTPGHETFTAMRARGAKVTDIVVLVVAADDGVMPQTIESIHHANAANVPIVVAVNKCDKPDANPDRVRQELTEYGVVPEEWGGQNMFVNISAKKHMGIDDLLETILLQADVLELKANPNTFASGYVLEAKLDRGRGSVATVLVSRGTLRIGDSLVAGTAYGRVRAMLGQHGQPVEEADPSDPVEILGLQSVPAAGDEFRVFSDERDARDLAEQRSLKARIEEQNKVKHVTLENLFDTMEDSEVKELNLVVKADVQGSIEALSDSLGKMDQSEVRINIIHSAVGAITETDVTLADASNAIIIGFGVRPEAKARTAAERQGVQIKCYSVIYKAIEDIDAARIGMLKPTEEEQQTGAAEVRDTFKVPKVGIAAGCMVTEGEISRDDQVRLVRDGIVVYDGTLASMRRFKDDVKSVKSGFECGLGLSDYQDIHVGDVIEGYKLVQVARTE